MPSIVPRTREVRHRPDGDPARAPAHPRCAHAAHARSRLCQRVNTPTITEAIVPQTIFQGQGSIGPRTAGTRRLSASVSRNGAGSGSRQPGTRRKDGRSDPVTESEKEQVMEELATLRERVRYLEEVEKEFATLARALKIRNKVPVTWSDRSRRPSCLSRTVRSIPSIQSRRSSADRPMSFARSRFESSTPAIGTGLPFTGSPRR